MGGAATEERVDAIVIGGGFYGCCLALFLRSVFDRVVVLEAESTLLSRASLVNQARIHTGFHYPRSFVTARRSLALYERFIAEFSDAVVDDFTMLYAIARYGSKVTPQRFEKMYRDLKAPIAQGSAADRSLFDPARVAGVYRCREHAFNAVILRDLLAARMAAVDVDVRLSSTAEEISAAPDMIGVTTAQGSLSAPLVVDATYGQIAGRGGPSAPQQALKYELTELALIEPPEALAGLGVTVMDGPFFSVMPFPARDCYSLTHVRYTPHRAWVSGKARHEATAEAPQSHWMHMQRDAQRFMPPLKDLDWRGSLYETKTVLLRNERDDGRPILLAQNQSAPGLLTVLGGKLDNIYDLFDAMRGLGGHLAEAHPRFVGGAAMKEVS